MSRRRFSLQNVLKLSLWLWWTVFLIVFGTLAIIMSVYELLITETPELTPVYLLFASVGIIALGVGIRLFLRRRHRISQETQYRAKSHIAQGELVIQVKLPQHHRVKEVILDTEPVQVGHTSHLPVRIRKR